jgi:hypothetical protein
VREHADTITIELHTSGLADASGLTQALERILREKLMWTGERLRFSRVVAGITMGIFDDWSQRASQRSR